MRALALLVGLVLLAFGLLFAAQGAGLVMWPADSFMLAQRQWVLYGAILAVAGIGVIWWSRQRGRR